MTVGPSTEVTISIAVSNETQDKTTENDTVKENGQEDLVKGELHDQGEPTIGEQEVENNLTRVCSL